ncbi:MAG TPA: cupin domain-containing protein [Nitrososphaeraceae archaeon]|nr:cupin domain-containing protein [Nitrososphaeraceae archaeon]
METEKLTKTINDKEILLVNLSKLELPTFYGAEDEPKRRVSGTFPLCSATGTKSSSVVYFELEPNFELGTHTDSGEETVFIIEGTVEVTIKNRQKRLVQGEMALIPEMEPHNFKNVGSKKAKVMGFFPKPDIVATFEKVFMPMNQNIIDTTQMPVANMK